MKKALALTGALLVSLLATEGFSDTEKGGKIDAKKEFEKHCAVCHPNGGNIVNPQKPLNKSSLAANGVKTARDIVAKMRNPGPGMTKFDAKTMSNKEATAIAAYVLKTFK